MRVKRLQLISFEPKATQYARAFSLTEVLIAMGILAVAMVFIAGLFPTAIYFSTVATERTIAAAAADEAFAKIRLYGIKFNAAAWPDINDPAVYNHCVDYNDVSPNDVSPIKVNPEEFLYPSIVYESVNEGKYFWSALCRRLSPDLTKRNVQVTVFVTRKAGLSTKYYRLDPISKQILPDGLWPVPVPIVVQAAQGNVQVRINDRSQHSFINAGSTIVDGLTGSIYRVLRRNGNGLDPEVVVLERPWLGDSRIDAQIWVVPPPVGGGRYPGIAVYQKVLRF